MKRRPSAQPIRRNLSRKRLPQIQWKDSQPYPRGGSFLESRDGMFRLSTYDSCDGIAMVPEYALWQYKRGSWHRVGEETVSAATKAHRGKPRPGAIRRLTKIARIRSAELDSDDDEEYGE